MSGNNAVESWMANLTFTPQHSFTPKQMPLIGTVLLPEMTNPLDRETYLSALTHKLAALEKSQPGGMALLISQLPIPDLPADPTELLLNPDFRAWLQPITAELPIKTVAQIPDHQVNLDLDQILTEIDA